MTTNRRKVHKNWHKVRIVALERDNYLCVHCLKTGKITEAKEVDHITPYAEAPHLELKLSNLQSLCKACHIQKTRQENSDKHIIKLKPRGFI